MQYRHPPQEPLRGIAQNLPLRGERWERGAACDAARAASPSVAEARRARAGARQTPNATQPRWRSCLPLGLTQFILLSESAGDGEAGLFLHAQNYF